MLQNPTFAAPPLWRTENNAGWDSLQVEYFFEEGRPRAANEAVVEEADPQS